MNDRTPAEVCQEIGEVFRKAYFADDSPHTRTDADYYRGQEARIDREYDRNIRQGMAPIAAKAARLKRLAELAL